MDITSQPQLDESPDISPVQLVRNTASVSARLDRIETALNLN